MTYDVDAARAEVRARALAIKAERDAQSTPPDHDPEKVAKIAARRAALDAEFAAEVAEIERRAPMVKAQKLLEATDFVPGKALERSLTLNPAWSAWREQLREVVRGNSREIPDEPERYGTANEGVPVGNTLPPRDQIPAELERFAEADETAHEFRERIKNLWQRFGIEEGRHTADMPALSAEEKIAMRDIDIANERAGNWIGR